MLDALFKELKVPGVSLRLGSLGSPGVRRAYLEELKAHLRAHEAELSKDVRERIEINPLRAFDSDEEETRAVMATAPTIVERLDGEDLDHFEAVRAYLDASEIEYSIDETLVRGLDYYTRTIFSFVCDRLGAQSEIGGGGRYDGLIEQLGGPPTPAVGWAAGIERIALAMGERRGAVRRDAFVAFAEEDRQVDALELVTELRRAGLSAELDLGGRSLKGQLKHADRMGALVVLIFESDGSFQRWDKLSGDRGQIPLAAAVDEVLKAKEGEAP